MDTLALALGPAFAAGFAFQQLLELLDPLASRIVSGDNKKLALGSVSLILGLLLAFSAGLRVLQPLGFAGPDWLDAIITGVIISAGTEGFNSIMKFLGYAKENKKKEVREETGSAPAS